MRRVLERARLPRRLALTAALVGGLVAGTAMPAAAQGPASGGQNGGTPQSTKTTPTGDGVSSPELTWTTTLTDHRQTGGGEYEPVFDSEGHILYQGKDFATDPDREVLVAIDRETGDVDWELAGVSDDCGVAASDDGMIYAVTDFPTGPEQLLAIDAATGDIVDTFTPQLHDGDGMSPCRESLRLADDGTLINLNSYDFDMHMQAFDTNEGLSLKWTRHYHIEDTGGADAESTSWLTRPVISADGSALYHCRQELEEERPDSANDRNWFEKIDLATGTLIDEVAIHETVPCTDRGVVAIDGGAIVAASGNGAPYKMLRVDDDGDDLSIAWETIFSRDEAIDESGVVNYPTDSLTLADDTIVTRGAGGGIYIGVDPATGQVEWQYRSEGFNNGYDNHSADRFGNVYVTNHDAALESFTSDGARRFAVTAEDLYGGTDIVSVKAILVGPDGGVFVRGVADGNHSAFFRVDTGPARRIAGVSRFDTAAQLALQSFGPTVDTVYLATGGTFPDALAGGPLASITDAPVLLASSSSLPAETADALASLRPANVIAIGGTAAIGDDVLAQAGTAAGGAATDRIFGMNRFGTAAAVASAMPASDTMYLGTGMSFPDALVGGPTTDGAPIVLATRDALPQETVAILGDRQPSRIVALGGRAAVSDAVLAQAAAAAGGAATERLAGADRYATSVRIAQQVVDRGTFTGTVYVAVGTSFPDAVAAAPAAEGDGAPIVLTAPDAVPDAVSSWLGGLAGLEEIVILGGTAAISPAVEAELAALVA